MRDQNDAKKLKKTRFQEADREGLNASLIGGKTTREQNRAEDVADSKKACQKQGALQTA